MHVNRSRTRACFLREKKNSAGGLPYQGTPPITIVTNFSQDGLGRSNLIFYDLCVCVCVALFYQLERVQYILVLDVND